MTTGMEKYINKCEIDARKQIEMITATAIVTEADYVVATHWLHLIVDAVKEIKAKQKEQTDPLKAQLDAAKKQFVAPLELFATAEKLTRDKINAWLLENRKRKEAAALAEQQARQKIVDKEIKKLDRQAAKADQYDSVTKAALNKHIAAQKSALIDSVTKAADIKQSAPGATVRMIWDFEIENIEKVPTEFLTINSAAVREAIKAGRREIPGLKIFQKTSIAIK